MTSMLASVCSVREARLVEKAGVDIIDLKDPKSGALGALPLNLCRQIVTELDGVLPVSATIGDMPFVARLIEPAIKNLAKTGVDIIKVGVFGELNRKTELNLLRSLSGRGLRIVLVIFAENYNPSLDLTCLAEAGLLGVMLDTSNKESGNLREKTSQASLLALIRQARKHNLLSGLAGSLTGTDIEPLLSLKPDYLGFRGGLCQSGARSEELDEIRLRTIREQIPLKQSIILPTNTAV
ncbi:MAG: hypothetical protein GKR93_07725 [Gammaproteobacteria bacterium]|nr:hypothetical protein [Gammaproteobacteria bacterium]